MLRLSAAWRGFRNHFDAHKLWEKIKEEAIREQGTYRVDWLRVIPFIGIHIACLGIIWVGWSWPAVALAVLLYVVRMFGITGFYHRYFSHKTFKTSRVCQFAFAVVGNSAGQRGPLWWAAHHRHHHTHSDHEEDAHSPHVHGFLWSHMFWFCNRPNFVSNLKRVPDLAKYRELVWLDRYDIVVPALLALCVFCTGVALDYFFPALGTSGTQMLVWGFFVSTVVLFHGTCTINSLSHMIGRRRFKTSDQSRNSVFLAFVTLGEGWHNNHHHYPNSTRQGFYWWEIDLTYYGLKVLSWLGLIWDLRPVPERILEQGRQQSQAA